MTAKPSESGLASRVERVYLAMLRVLTLVVASICILGALLLALDGGRRLLMSTDVVPEPVAISTEDALGPLVRAAGEEKVGGGASGVEASSAAKAKHAAFMKGAFATYYETYRRFALASNKPEDKLLSPAELASALGYSAEALDAEPAPSEHADDPDAPANLAQDAISEALARTSLLFQTDETFSTRQIEVVRNALADPRLVAKAAKYKAAQKTAQSCSTVYQVRSVWDSNSTACAEWYYRPYGCPVRRSVPVEQCVPAYPEDVESPLETFAKLDESYRLAWSSKTTSAQSAADTKAAEKREVKAGAPAAFVLALQIFGGFLVVMFMFLLIAIERHLRRLASTRPASLVAAE
ncbi:hypothetical protein [Phenylobacterium koreense]|uniref:Uncharacterized protein n=1 Tax=Phenylobacterium koreense TaxID=266125 RepID=A0ABV2EMC2_9CAUL